MKITGVLAVIYYIISIVSVYVGNTTSRQEIETVSRFDNYSAKQNKSEAKGVTDTNFDGHLLQRKGANGFQLFTSESEIMEIAFNISSIKHNGRNKECSREVGWGIYGLDLGCCGNYKGCCKVASKFCYLHDVVCQCCRYGILVCGPDCKLEPGCKDTRQAISAENNVMETGTKSTTAKITNITISTKNTTEDTEDGQSYQDTSTNIPRDTHMTEHSTSITNTTTTQLNGVTQSNRVSEQFFERSLASSDSTIPKTVNKNKPATATSLRSTIRKTVRHFIQTEQKTKDNTQWTFTKGLTGLPTTYIPELDTEGSGEV